MKLPCLIDTDWIIHYLNGRKDIIQEHLARFHARETHTASKGFIGWTKQTKQIYPVKCETYFTGTQ
jgi:hypothetical protein